MKIFIAIIIVTFLSGITVSPVSGQDVVRCLTPVFLDEADQKPDHAAMSASFRHETMAGLKEMQSRMAAFDDHVYESESGIFRLHYQTEGADSVWSDETGIGPEGVPDYIVKAAQYADSSYRYQVEQLGYADPLDQSVCGDSILPRMHLRFGDIRDGSGNKVFGYFNPSSPDTLFINSTFDDPGFQNNDNEESSYKGTIKNEILGALKVTIAHELKHAIQYATNCLSGDAGSFEWTEMDATMMEDVVFPNVNDYRNYIQGSAGIFGNPQTKFPVEYSHVTFMLHYHEYFGPGFWVDVWDVIGRAYPGKNIAMTSAMSEVIEAHNNGFGDGQTSLESTLIRNYLWHMASGNRAAESGGYGFAASAEYPDPVFFGSFDSIPHMPYNQATVPHHAGRFFEFHAGEMHVAGQVALALFNSDTPLGIGLLAKKKSGEITEHIVTPEDSTLQKLALPFHWQDLEWLGMAVINLNSSAPLNRFELLAGTDPDGSGPVIERLIYGDLSGDGELTDEDALLMLENALHPADLPVSAYFQNDLSRSGRIGHYDAGKVFRLLDNRIRGFPMDENRNGLGPEWSRFTQHEPGDNDLVTAGREIKALTEDTITAALNIDTDLLFLDLEADMVLSVSGARDEAIHSLYLELAIDYPPEGGGTGKGDPIQLDIVDIFGNSLSDGRDGWRYEWNEEKLRLAYASSEPLEDPLNPGDILNIRFVPENEGYIHFRIDELRIDEHQYAINHEGMDTIRVLDPVGSETEDQLPSRVVLHQNYPNPFNPETKIEFDLPESMPVRLRVYDVTGRLLTTLVDDYLQAGRHRTRLDIRDHPGLGSGVYLYHLQAGSKTITRKMTLVK